MNSLSKLISEFSNGLQQTNRYVLQIIPSSQFVVNIISDSNQGPGGILSTISKALSIEDSVVTVPQVLNWLAQGYLCTGVRLPDRGFAITELQMYGYTERFPTSTEYTPLECEFVLPYALNISNDSAVPRFFNYWQNQIQRAQLGPDSGFDFRFPSDYYATALLTLLDRKNSGTITYQFTNVYPKTVNSAQLSWETTNFLKLPVSFNFSYWTVLPQAESLALSFVDKAIEQIL